MRRTLILVALGALFIGACASAAAPNQGEPGERLPADEGGLPAASPAATGSSPDQARADPEQRLIVRVGALELEVTDVQAAYAQARQLALRLGGYVGDSQFATDRAGRPTATVVLRIPADRYEEALEALRPMAKKIVLEQSKETDVTSQVVDLDARLTNLRASEAALVKLFDRAGKISDILEVQRELTGVREQIEQLTAQKQMLEKQAALATLTVTFEMAPEPVAAATKSWDPSADVQRAVAQLVELAQGVARAGIWLAIVGAPVTLIALVVLLVGWRLARRAGFRLRRPAPGGPPEGWTG